MVNPTKKLYRSDADKILTGVIGGLAEYLEINSVILRLIWVLIVIFTGFAPGVIAYILAIVIIPKKNPSEPPAPQNPAVKQ